MLEERTDEVIPEAKTALYGHTLWGEPISPPPRGPIADRFLIAPFSILNTREGFWQDRKRRWIDLGIKGEIGRGTRVVPNGSLRGQDQDGCFVRGYGRTFGQDRVKGENDNFGSGPAGQETTGASVFDPVLCECVYRWWCPPGGQVVDPFAGGSVRGLMAHLLGYRYWGCDLRAEQIGANEEQAAAIVPANRPQWVCGDALQGVPNAPDADLIFTCPPYGDLERYSDIPEDLSTMEYHTFLATFKRILLAAYKRLRPNRFSCFVVGDFRDPRGYYRGFVADTIHAARDVGFHFYNEAILVNVCGSMPVRIRKQFDAGRKLGKVHQNVLVFVKGNPKEATVAIRSAGRGDS